jgi:hypothetical protein
MPAIWSVAVVESDGGKDIYVGREDGTLQRYKGKQVLTNPHESTPVLTLAAHSGPITGIVATTADDVTSISTDGFMKSFNTAAEVEGKREGKSIAIGTPARCILGAGEQTIIGGQDGNVYVYQGEGSTKLSGHTDLVSALAMGESLLFSSSYDQTIRGWDVAAARSVFLFLGHTNQVKVLQVVNNVVFSAGRDDTLRVWTLPEAGEGAASSNPPAGGEGGEEGGAAAAASSGADQPTVVRQAALIELPAGPHSSAVSGSNLCIGFGDGKVRVINTKDLMKSVQSFTLNANATFKKCKKHFEANAAVAIKNLKIVHKKTLKAAKNELLKEAAAAAKAAADAAKAARNAGRDAEEEEAEPAAEEEEGQEVTLGEEREAALAALTETKKAELAAAIAQVNAATASKVSTLKPIVGQGFVCEQNKFDRVSFTRTYTAKDHSGPASSYLAIAVDGVTAFCGTADHLAVVECRPGVTVL